MELVTLILPLTMILPSTNKKIDFFYFFVYKITKDSMSNKDIMSNEYACIIFNIDTIKYTLCDYLITKYTTEELNNITRINCYTEKSSLYMQLGANISDILPNLLSLQLYNIILDESDLTNCVNLKYLSLNSVKCENVILNNFTKLDNFSISNMCTIKDSINIEKLDISSCCNLSTIYINDANISDAINYGLDLSNNKKLKQIYLKRIIINEIYFNLECLEHLELTNNKLTNIELICPKLNYLEISNNLIAEINLSYCPNLEYLNLSKNKIENIDSIIAKNNINILPNKIIKLNICDNPIKCTIDELICIFPMLDKLFVDPVQINFPRKININYERCDF